MPRRLFPLILFASLASCGADNRAASQSANGGTAVEDATLTKLQLTSDAFQDGQPIPKQHTCDGANQTPALSWGEPPQGTKSFALVIDDPDAPGGTFRHWGAYDIPASTQSIAAGQKVGTEVTNDKGGPGYTGPCPPPGHGLHHYHFKLFALDAERLRLPPGSKNAGVENPANQHPVGKAELVGTF